MSPEYAMGGIFSEKSDVYSFGVLVLEIISSKKNSNFYFHEQQLGFLAYAWHLWTEGKGVDFVGEELAKAYSFREAMRCIHIGLLCVQDDAADRPTMPEVVFMLSSDTDAPQPKQPTFAWRSSVPHGPQQLQNSCSTNDTTITYSDCWTLTDSIFALQNHNVS
ncbi:hypothetical protein ACLB2K_024799 [Fragaria x ananassa]